MGGGRRLCDHLPLDRSEEGGDSCCCCSSDSSSSEASLSDEALRRCKTYLELLQSYESPPTRAYTLQEAKDAIRRHKPGDWIGEVGESKKSDYELPEITTLLLIGPRGSGKSSLVNRISRVFEEDKFAPDRAQVSHNLSVTDGSCFLQEYMIPRNSKSLCVYDTRSLSPCSSENRPMLCSWMTNGVRHGQMVIRNSDTMLLKQRIQIMARLSCFCTSKERTVNFVIFVVDGVSVLKSMDGKDSEYVDMLVANFNYPYLSFKDNKPAVVVTHGDELSFHERARVRTHLGEILGIPPSKQIFDIPDTSDCDTELAIVDMLRYCIEHADRNLPFEQNCLLQGLRMLGRKMEGVHFDELIIMLEFLIICLCLVFLFSKWWEGLWK